ncbi:C40 family peptidase [Streptomyces sp. IBSNAI002]|uniref:C40 family peptidase n=1 Tax=Streptomyces sp. IBSNAI002 TaxID=3457500 RepID=UPI003FD59585
MAHTTASQALAPAPAAEPVRAARHRRPRRAISRLVVRAGVTGGVLGTTLAMARLADASPVPASAGLDLPFLEPDGAAEIAGAIDSTADALHAEAHAAELTGLREASEAEAGAQAQAKARAKAKAQAEEQAHRSRAEAEAADRADRTTDRGPVATGSAAAIVAFARAQVGKAYVMGGTGPASFDCSGLVQAAYRHAGVAVPRVSQLQSTAGRQVPLSDLKPGDILYWGKQGTAHHVALYIGNGRFIGAQNPRAGVAERSLAHSRPSGAVRIV